MSRKDAKFFKFKFQCGKLSKIIAALQKINKVPTEKREQQKGLKKKIMQRKVIPAATLSDALSLQEACLGQKQAQLINTHRKDFQTKVVESKGWLSAMWLVKILDLGKRWVLGQAQGALVWSLVEVRMVNELKYETPHRNIS